MHLCGETSVLKSLCFYTHSGNQRSHPADGGLCPPWTLTPINPLNPGSGFSVPAQIASSWPLLRLIITPLYLPSKTSAPASVSRGTMAAILDYGVCTKLVCLRSGSHSLPRAPGPRGNGASLRCHGDETGCSDEDSCRGDLTSRRPLSACSPHWRKVTGIKVEA